MMYFSILLLFAFSFLNEIGGIYIHKRNGINYTIEIKKDSSFSYTRPAIMSGRITETGIWRIEKNILFLEDSIGTIHSKSEITGKENRGQAFALVKVVDENNKLIPEIQVAVNNDDFFKETDTLGIVKFDYTKIKKTRINQPDNSVEVITLNSKKWRQELAVKDIFNNEITIIKDFNPKIVYNSRTRRLTIRNDILIFPNPNGINENQIFEFKRTKK